MNNNDIEKWLLSRGFFFKNCQKCVERKAGCAKDCKFYQNYRRSHKNEQRWTN